MKYNKKVSTIPNLRAGILLLLVTGLLGAGCSDKLADTVSGEPSATTVSSYDGQPIMEMDDLSYYEGSYFERWTGRLAGAYGPELVKAVNREAAKAKANNEAFGSSLLLKDVLSGSKAKSGAAMSTHLRLSEPDGETEEFLLSVRWYIPEAESGQAKASTLSAEDTWLALSPDRFYLQDDEQGNEQWPVRIVAVNMADSSRKLEVTFNKEGIVSATSPDSQPKEVASADVPGLVLVEATPIIEPNYIEPCEPNCGGGGGGSGRVDDWSRGEDTGSYIFNSTYFVVKSMRLATTGDGDGAAELQMFVKNNDDYAYNFPVSYKYRFDTVIRTDPIYGGYDDHTIIKGADKGGFYDRYYEVPDVDQAGVTYDSFRLFIKDPGGNYVLPPVNKDYFPLFNLTQKPGSWRVVMSDDDKDYADFSRRRASEHAQNIQTYHMNNGHWGQVYTGFTVRRKTYGSSDDPIYESGVRRITRTNALDRQDANGNINAYKYYDSGNSLFKYVFQLRTY